MLARFFKKPPRSPLDPDGRIRSAFLVCTTHRSGSSLFCEGLKDAGWGNPNEYFDDTLLAVWREKWSLPASADALTYLREMIARQTSREGVFGAKLMWHQTGLLRQMLQPVLAPDRPQARLAELLSAAFPGVRYFWLRRHDQTAQAISLARAQQTGRWHSVDTKGWVGVAPVAKEEHFDFTQIDSIRGNLIEWDQQWGDFFKTPELPVQTLVYEEFTARYEQTIREALAFLGRKDGATCPIAAPRHEKLADATSLAWKERFLAEKAE